ncbi:MAG: glycosyl hydrolase [Ignavibacteriaceae bacterium]|nr:glycosyl hydrolase [Ignavibacteriaceae bacterium]
MKNMFSLSEIAILLLIITPLIWGQSDNAITKTSYDIHFDLPARSFIDDEFVNPALEYRPFPMLHNANKDLVLRSREYGYGGVVANVSFEQYLTSDKNWKNFTDLTSYIIDTLGLHMWIYDELGYPSGTAGGLVLKNNPGWQAEGIVCLTALSADSGIVEIKKSYGLLKNVSAFAYRGTAIDSIDYTSGIDISRFVDKSGNLKWPSPGKGWLAVCTYSKYFYEGTHATFNWTAKRRYINLLMKEPIDKFIDITYKNYFNHVGKYFGKGIDAFFTDEPSLMGTYFVYAPPVTPSIVDTPDVKVPHLLTVNYSDNISSQFKSVRGYDLNKYLSMLFGDSTEQGKKLRWDYYKTLSDIVSENYTGMIGKYCSEHNVAMSGHILFEEEICSHPVFEGDLLQIYKNMQYPGIDLLTSHPETALLWACTTAKQASSAAHFYGRKHVMSEVSDAFDEIKGDVTGRLGAIAVQYALGVDHINSYYPIDKMSKDENKLFTETIGRFGYILEGGRHDAKIALYYPIEGVWTETLPPENIYSYNSKVKSINDNYSKLSYQLLSAQHDFDYLDYSCLQACSLKDGKIVTPCGEQYSVFIMPQTSAIDSRTIEFLMKAANNGVKIIIQNSKSVIAENGIDKDSVNKEYSKLLSSRNTIISFSISDVVDEIEKLNINDVKLSEANSKIIYLKKQFAGSDVYMLVNISDSKAKLDAYFNSNGRKIKIWDPFTDVIKNDNSAKVMNNKLFLSGIEVESKKAIFITFE